MSALSIEVFDRFYKLCNWAYEVWINHIELFDNNPKQDQIKNSFANDTFHRLSIISQEYALHQIAKLHDQAVVSGKITLSIDYVVNYGGWSDPVLAQLIALKKELDDFALQLRTARNKILSHNDLNTIINETILGTFQDGNDIIYFKKLQELVNIISLELKSVPSLFNDLVSNDVIAFNACIWSGLEILSLEKSA